MMSLPSDVADVLTPRTRAAIAPGSGTEPAPPPMGVLQSDELDGAHAEMHDMMMHALNTIVQRIEAIEGYVRTLQGAVAASGVPQDRNIPMETPSELHDRPEPHGGPCPYGIIVDNLKQEWYTERPFPPFVIRVVDRASNQFVTETEGWTVLITVMDGFGRVVDGLLKDPQAGRLTMIDGVAEASGLKFARVSSRNGGKFNLRVELTDPPHASEMVERLVSPDLHIMSSRLFTTHKGSMAKLCSTDGVEELPGFGKLYSKRLEKLGITTIKDLSEVGTGPHDPTRRAILEVISKLKGAMTDDKLVQAIHRSVAVVNGDFQSPGSKRSHPDTPSSCSGLSEALSTSPSNKRPQLETAGHVMPALDSGDHERRPLNAIEMVSSALAVHCPSAAQLVDWTMQSNPTRESHLPEEDECAFLDEAGLDATHGYEYALQGAGSREQFRSGVLTPPTHKAKVDTKHHADRFPLHLAVTGGNVELCKVVVREMEARGLAVTATATGLSPLMLACSLDLPDIVHFLLSLPQTRPEEMGPNGFTALHFAALSGSKACAEALVQRLPLSVLCPTSSNSLTPVIIAVLRGDSATARVLMSRLQPRQYSHSLHGLSLGHLACLSGSCQTIDLIESVVGLSTEPTVCPSLMHCAAVSGSAEAVAALRGRGVSCSSEWGQGWTPLHVAAQAARHEAVKALATDPALLNLTTHNGNTALDLASGESVPALERRGAKRGGGKPEPLLQLMLDPIQHMIKFTNKIHNS